MNSFKLTSLALLLSSHLVMANETINDPFDLAFEDLLGIEVTSVSKHRQPLSNAPAAIYVLTNDDIIRSGATSIPQALRGVPGLHIAQIDSQKWAVSSRGFNGRYNNKLLVMIDGRTLYSPEFSGVYWEVQDTLMADIERIEIIRGPSAAMWGANAVNGVINITTKHSADTMGGYVELGAGDYEQALSGFRYGGKVTDNITARAYAKGFKRDSLEHHSQDISPITQLLISDVDKNNDWHHMQAGGRMDIQISPESSLTLSADLYDSEMNQLSQYPSADAPPFYSFALNDDIDNRGLNILANYTKALSADSEYGLKVYYDYTSRKEFLTHFTTDTIDLDFHHQFKFRQDHNVIWGLGYRHISDELLDSPIVTSSAPPQTNTNLWSAFIRDEVTLINDELWLTLASRVEHNSYTDIEVQPNLRLMWKLNNQHKLWSSISYAVRTPSRGEVNSISSPMIYPPNPLAPLPTKLLLKGDDNYKSEELLSYEVGYRFTPTSSISVDSTAFYNDYDQLRSISNEAIDFSKFPNYLIQPTHYANGHAGHNYGFELSNQWIASDSLKFKLNYAYTRNEFDQEQPQNTDTPKHIASLLADWRITKSLTFDATWRYVDSVEILDIVNMSTVELDSYHGVDLGIHWQISPAVSVNAYGKNLFNTHHVEYETELYQLPARVEASYYGKITLKF